MSATNMVNVPTGTSLLPFITDTEGGLAFNFPWSETIGESGSGFRVAKLLDKALVAFQYEPEAKLILFFPAGAIIVVLDGKLVAADESSPTKAGGLTFKRNSIRCLRPYDMMHIKPQTWACLRANEVETTFVLFHPGGFRLGE